VLEIIRPHRLNLTNVAKLSERDDFRSITREQLTLRQLNKLNKLLRTILPSSQFYRDHLGNVELPILSLEDWAALPTISKDQLVPQDSSDIACNHSYSSDRYTRLHRTSGTRGRPMIVMDTAEDWQWWLDTWQFVWDAAALSDHENVFMAFSFGPFIGFWTAFDAAIERGYRVIPGGGLSTAARLDLMKTTRSTVLCCTPSYALHLAEEAARQSIDIKKFGIKAIVVAGEPGGSVQAIRARIEEAWNARVIDHAGATEIGPWGVGTDDGKDLFIIESEFIAEYLPIENARTSNQPKLKELVLTSLGRYGAPALRYRTGDIVDPERIDETYVGFARLKGGILGRIDDMLIIRGVNVFPSSIEAILRSVSSISEYRITARKHGEMDQLTIEIEDSSEVAAKVVELLSVQLGLRVEVIPCETQTLPRHEGKANRFIDLR
jgi:phenylacetate-CoA ligase